MNVTALRKRADDQSFDREPPVREPSGPQAFELLACRMIAFRERMFRDLAAGKLSGQRLACQQPMRSIGHRFAGAVEAGHENGFAAGWARAR